jgi:hypothetical protein
MRAGQLDRLADTAPGRALRRGRGDGRISQRACGARGRGRHPGPSVPAAAIQGREAHRAGVTGANNAYSWPCRSPWRYARAINVNAQCAAQSVPGSYAGLASRSNAYSWYCQRRSSASPGGTVRSDLVVLERSPIFLPHTGGLKGSA